MGRYDNNGDHKVKDWSGRTVSVSRFSLRAPKAVVGLHQRRQGERLDHLAFAYLGDATKTWALVDANDAMGVEQTDIKHAVRVPEGD